MSNPITTQAAVNALTGEKGMMQVQFPITGDKELDFMSAVLVLANALQLEPCDSERACAYLTKRFNSMVIDLSNICSPAVQQTGQYVSTGSGNMAGLPGVQYVDQKPLYDPDILDDSTDATKKAYQKWLERVLK